MTDRPTKKGNLRRQIEESRRTFEENEEFELLAAGHSEDIATAHKEEPAKEESKHKDLTPETAPQLLPKRTKQVSAGENAEQETEKSDPVFSALIRLRRPKTRWLDIR